MTDQERKAMEMAIDALDSCEFDYDNKERQVRTFDALLVNAAHRLLHEALNVDAIDTSSTYVDKNEKRKHEPVAWANPTDLTNFDMKVRTSGSPLHTVPLYTAPSSKPWVSLTDEEILEGAKYSWVDYQAFQSVAWWADEKLKEKNNG